MHPDDDDLTLDDIDWYDTHGRPRRAPQTRLPDDYRIDEDDDLDGWGDAWDDAFNDSPGG